MRHPVRAAGGTAPAAGISLTGASSRRRSPARLMPAGACESRRRAEAGTVCAMSERVGFLGLGIMGSRMAANLARAGFELKVWNRTRERAEKFAAEHGASVAATPAEAASGAAIVITMVVDGPQVEQVLLGEDGVAAGAAPGTLCVDCSTIGPAATQEIAAQLENRRLTLIDAPVTGSSPKAQDGTLTFMVG